MLAAGNGGFAFADGVQFRFGGLITSRLYRGDGDRLAGHLEFQQVAGLDASLALNCGGTVAPILFFTVTVTARIKYC
jgi:hypothetical protein